MIQGLETLKRGKTADYDWETVLDYSCINLQLEGEMIACSEDHVIFTEYFELVWGKPYNVKGKLSEIRKMIAHMNVKVLWQNIIG